MLTLQCSQCPNPMTLLRPIDRNETRRRAFFALFGTSILVQTLHLQVHGTYLFDSFQFPWCFSMPKINKRPYALLNPPAFASQNFPSGGPAALNLDSLRPDGWRWTKSKLPRVPMEVSRGDWGSRESNLWWGASCRPALYRIVFKGLTSSHLQLPLALWPQRPCFVPFAIFCDPYNSGGFGFSSHQLFKTKVATSIHGFLCFPFLTVLVRLSTKFKCLPAKMGTAEETVAPIRMLCIIKSPNAAQRTDTLGKSKTKEGDKLIWNSLDTSRVRGSHWNWDPTTPFAGHKYSTKSSELLLKLYNQNKSPALYIFLYCTLYTRISQEERTFESRHSNGLAIARLCDELHRRKTSVRWCDDRYDTPGNKLPQSYMQTFNFEVFFYLFDKKSSTSFEGSLGFQNLCAEGIWASGCPCPLPWEGCQPNCWVVANPSTTAKGFHDWLVSSVCPQISHAYA